MIQVLTGFTRLQTLKLCVTISGASDFTEEVHEKAPMLFEDKAKNAVEILFRKLYNGNKLLREVELWFTLIQETLGATGWEQKVVRVDKRRLKATKVYEPYEVGKDVKVKVEILDRWINEYGELRGSEEEE